MEGMQHATPTAAGGAEDGGKGRGEGFLAKGPGVLGRVGSNLRVTSLWQEVSGSLGDIGTFLPILLALSLVNGLSFGTTLIFTGIYNIITGGLFGVPMPVQPMKSIAAVAIGSDPLTVAEIMAAGITTASLLVFLGVTGLMNVVQKLVPLPVVRGIQLSQGISFGMTAVKYIVKNQNLQKAKSTSDRGWLGSDGLFLAFAAFFFVVLSTGAGDRIWARVAPVGEPVKDEEAAVERRSFDFREKALMSIPSALIVFVVGFVIAVCRKPSAFNGFRFGPAHMSTVHISRHAWSEGFTRAAVPQIPLSLLNSVVATCKLSHDLFPEKGSLVTPRTVATSVGMMNLVGCWFGAMPACHGCGGLAGQYKFGARSGLSVVILGTVKLVVGLVFGSSLLRVLAQFPVGLLGVLLFFSGLELAMTCRDQNTRFDAFVMLVITFGSLGTSNATKGFVFGLLVWAVAKARQLFVEHRPITDFFK